MNFVSKHGNFLIIGGIVGGIIDHVICHWRIMIYQDGSPLFVIIKCRIKHCKEVEKQVMLKSDKYEKNSDII